jgi:hypothetical protein
MELSKSVTCVSGTDNDTCSPEKLDSLNEIDLRRPSEQRYNGLRNPNQRDEADNSVTRKPLATILRLHQLGHHQVPRQPVRNNRSNDTVVDLKTESTKGPRWLRRSIPLVVNSRLLGPSIRTPALVTFGRGKVQRWESLNAGDSPSQTPFSFLSSLQKDKPNFAIVAKFRLAALQRRSDGFANIHKSVHNLSAVPV